jgi:hypothetical protein
MKRVDRRHRYEASDVVIRPDGQIFYVVFDNSFRIGAFCTSASNCADRLLDWPNPSQQKGKSDFEGMTYNRVNGTYFVVQEAIPSASQKEKFQPNVFEIDIPHQATSVRVIESCLVNWFFDSDSKGLEGLEFVIHQRTGKSFLLGLCEANLCASKLNKDRESNNLGNGRLILLEKVAATSSSLSLNGRHRLDLSSFVFSSLFLGTERNNRFASLGDLSRLFRGVNQSSNNAPFHRCDQSRRQSTVDGNHRRDRHIAILSNLITQGEHLRHTASRSVNV